MTWNEHHASAISAVFSALNEAGLDWLVLRNHAGLPATNRSKDVDIGINKSQFSIAERVVSKAVSENNFEWKKVEDFQYVKCLTYFGVFDSVVYSIKIDLLDGFTFRGANVFAFPELFANSRSIDDFRIPNEVDDAAMLWLKPLITGGIVKPKYVGDIRQAAEGHSRAFLGVLERTLPLATARRAWSKIAAGDIEATVSMKRSLRWAVWRTAFANRPFHTTRDAVYHVMAELRRRHRRPPASFLSVAGPDGVGKTTFIERLAASLADLQVKDRDAILVEHFRPHILPNIKELITGRKEKIEAFHNPHRARPARLPSSILRIGYYWADYVLGYWGAIRRRCAAGKTVIFDRYFYDFLVDPRRSRLSLPLWVPQALLAVTPKPDLVFVLDGDPDMIFARKQELPRNEIARQLEAYRALAASDPDRFVLLDASQDPDLIVADALRQLVQRSYGRIDPAN